MQRCIPVLWGPGLHLTALLLTGFQTISKYLKKDAASRQIFVNPFLVGDVEIASFTN
jgi:hypothetical protein